MRHVLIGEDMFEAVDRIPFRHPLTLSRKASMRSPLTVSDEPMMVRAVPESTPWDKPVNMLAICLTLWKDDDLSRWFAIDRAEAMREASEPPLKSDGKPFSPPYAAAARRYAPPVKPEATRPASDEVDRLLKHAHEASVNGKPKPKG